MPVLDLTEREAQTLLGILRTEKTELENLIEECAIVRDKEELEGELDRVKSMLSKFA